MENCFYSSQAMGEFDNLFLQIIHEIWKRTNVPAQSWHVEWSLDRSWLLFSHKNTRLQQQGWKLHISAGIANAQEILHRVLPVLLADKAHFKIVASLSRLQALNQGAGGISQIGKFVTVYPQDEQDAIRLAVLLDKITDDFHSPNIPSDRVLRPGSLVHYRYGSFSALHLVQSPLGMLTPAIKNPDNTLVPDRRLLRYTVPSWVNDPFVASGVATELPKPTRLISDRYLLIATIASSPVHNVYLAADLDSTCSCIVKGPGLAWLYQRTPQDVNQLALHEADVLTTLAPHPQFPALLAVVEHEQQIFLVLEDIEGETLTAHMSTMTGTGRFIPLPQAIRWARDLAEMLGTIHAKGFVYNDLKSSNIIIDKSYLLHLVDFELTYKQGSKECNGRGTSGYMSPQRCRGDALTVFDDLYSFGALLYTLVTGAEPSQAPRHLSLLHRPVSLLRPGLPDSLNTLITRCLQEQPEERYASIEDVKDALATIELDEKHHIQSSSLKSQCSYALQSTRYRELAEALLTTLCCAAQKPPCGDGLAWVSTHPLSYGLLARDIHTGNAGTLLALAELTAQFEKPEAYSMLAEGASWLQSSPLLEAGLLPGLYVGEAGVAASLLRAGQVLQEEHLIIAASKRAHEIAALPFTSPDLFNGTAGRLRFHLFLWDETGEKEHLQNAIACGEHLITTAHINSAEEAHWIIPDGYESLSGKALPGYAHGAAGIADALSDLFEATGDERYVPTIQRAGRYLTHLAMPALDDQSGLNWPKIEGGDPTAAFWCHGATGIGRFFLHAAQCDLIPDAEEIAHRAAQTVMLGTRWAGPTQCHGLAGNIEFLLDMYRSIGKASYLQNAYHLARLLETFAVEEKGRVVFPADTPGTFTPDYMVGYAGIAVCLLRLSTPEQMPHQLSRSGFRTRPRILQEHTLKVEQTR